MHEEMMQLGLGSQELLNNSIVIEKSNKDINALNELSILRNGTLSAWDSLEYIVMTPTESEIVLDNPNKTVLIFREAFDKNWEAYLNNNRVPESQHYMCDDYANCWYINETGKNQIKVVYAPQKYVEILFLVSLATYIVCFVYLSNKKGHK